MWVYLIGLLGLFAFFFFSNKNTKEEKEFVKEVKKEYLEYTRAQVSDHNSEKDIWLVVDNEVYDVTPFLSSHPGNNFFKIYEFRWIKDT